MAIQLSTGFTKKILGRDSFIDIFQGGVIELYAGTKPASANDATSTSNLVGKITGHGSGVGLWFIQSGQWIARDPSQPWKFVAEYTRTAAWFRLRTSGDTGAFSYDLARVDGSVGLNAGDLFDMYVPKAAFTAGDTFILQQFAFTLPPIP